MNRNVRLFVLAAMLVMVAMFDAGCGKKHSLTQPNMGQVYGHLFGVVRIPIDSIPEAMRPENISWLKPRIELDHGYSTWERKSNSYYEFRTTYPTDSLTMTIGGQPARITPEGEFEAYDVPLGQQDIILYLRGEAANKAQVLIVQGKNDLTREIVYDPCCVMKAHPMTPNRVNEVFPCLSRNGCALGGYYFSDCYVSLFYGPWQYRWMCWAESMDKLSVWRPSNIWCNGTHNCSLWVHGWDWNAQRYHTHSWPWRP